MKFVIQRVSSATVHVPEHNESRSIQEGLLIYMGVSKFVGESYPEKIERFVKKIAHLKIFSDDSGKICRSLTDVGGEILLISNFTLHGRNKKGTQIDFGHAAPYQEAENIYNEMIYALQEQGLNVTTGEFGGFMRIESVVEGPVNVIREV